MITPDYPRLMAQYNAWQNESLTEAANNISEEARRQDRGAYFGSIFGTFNHLLWGDERWLARFEARDAPDWPSAESPRYTPDWVSFMARRRAMDQAIIAWAEGVEPEWLDTILRWRSGAAGGEFARPMGLLVTHFFNHQTHHRGQIHAMLTAAGARTEDTDLMLLP